VDHPVTAQAAPNDAPPFTRISPEARALITAYWSSSRRGRVLEFLSFNELVEVFEVLARGPGHVPAGAFPAAFARGAVSGQRRRRNLRAPFLVAAVLDCSRQPLELVSERLAARGVAHLMYGIGHLESELLASRWVSGCWGAVVVTNVLARGWVELEAGVLELAALAEVRPRPTSRSWRSCCFPLPAPLDDGAACRVLPSTGGTWLPSPPAPPSSNPTPVRRPRRRAASPCSRRPVRLSPPRRFDRGNPSPELPGGRGDLRVSCEEDGLSI
jgi:hypothetical protein